MYDVGDYSKKNLSSMVVDYIKDHILTGSLKSGDRVIESKLSEALNISRAPVREAMRELEKEGLITVTPRKGAHITEFNLDDIKEIFDIRLLLEVDIIKIIFENDLLTDKDIRNLTEIVNQMVAVALSSEEMEKKTMTINTLDIQFHTYIWEKSGSFRRVKILKDMFFQLRMAMMYDTKMTDNLCDTASDHYAIIKSLKEKDIRACELHLREHIMTYKSSGM